MSDTTDYDKGRDEKTGQFVKGFRGGPGRGKGSRNKLGEAFLEALNADFDEHGVATIEKVRIERPHEYLKVIANILPKDLNVNLNPTDQMSDDQLVERIRQLDSVIRPFLAIEGEIGTGNGTETEARH